MASAVAYARLAEKARRAGDSHGWRIYVKKETELRNRAARQRGDLK